MMKVENMVISNILPLFNSRDVIERLMYLVTEDKQGHELETLKSLMTQGYAKSSEWTDGTAVVQKDSLPRLLNKFLREMKGAHPEIAAVLEHGMPDTDNMDEAMKRVLDEVDFDGVTYLVRK